MAGEALAALDEAVALAGPLGWIRPFVEAGPPMADLLQRLQEQNDAVDDVDQLLTHFPTNESESIFEESSHGRQAPHLPVSPAPIPTVIKSPRPPVSLSSDQPLVEPLTHRELDVLDLLAQRFQNKEIADKLCISPATVKTHLKNIYQKLGVTGRREAVETAKDLGILS
jgi:LuxR family maltose regulon positive regulatory protein